MSESIALNPFFAMFALLAFLRFCELCLREFAAGSFCLSRHSRAGGNPDPYPLPGFRLAPAIAGLAGMTFGRPANRSNSTVPAKETADSPLLWVKWTGLRSQSYQSPRP